MLYFYHTFSFCRLLFYASRSPENRNNQNTHMDNDTKTTSVAQEPREACGIWHRDDQQETHRSQGAPAHVIEAKQLARRQAARERSRKRKVHLAQQTETRHDTAKQDTARPDTVRPNNARPDSASGSSISSKQEKPEHPPMPCDQKQPSVHATPASQLSVQSNTRPKRLFSEVAAQTCAMHTAPIARGATANPNSRKYTTESSTPPEQDTVHSCERPPHDTCHSMSEMLTSKKSQDDTSQADMWHYRRKRNSSGSSEERESCFR